LVTKLTNTRSRHESDIHKSGRRFFQVPSAVVSGLLNSKKLLRCTFGDNLERRQNAG
jgi:hypothetical protein